LLYYFHSLQFVSQQLVAGALYTTSTPCSYYSDTGIHATLVLIVQVTRSKSNSYLLISSV